MRTHVLIFSATCSACEMRTVGRKMERGYQQNDIVQVYLTATAAAMAALAVAG